MDNANDRCTFRELVLLLMALVFIDFILGIIFTEQYLQGAAGVLLKNRAGMVEAVTGFKAGTKEYANEFYNLLGLYFTLFVRLVEFVCLFVILRFILRKGAGAAGMDFSGVRRSALTGTAVSAIMGALVFAAAGVYYIVTKGNLFSYLEDPWMMPAAYMVSYLIPVAIAGPFIEEVIFRGIMYGSLRRHIGIWPGIIVSAFIFSGLHFVGRTGGTAWIIQTFVITFTGGLIFAWVYEKSGNVLGPYIVHSLGNAALFLLPKIIK